MQPCYWLFWRTTNQNTPLLNSNSRPKITTELECVLMLQKIWGALGQNLEQSKIRLLQRHIAKRLGGSVEDLERTIVPLPQRSSSKKFRGLWDQMWSCP